jgi:3-oxoacyl-[acyl-carrier-protein] synthase-1
MNRFSGNNTKQFFLASTGMITPLGFNSAMTAAAVNAGISAYSMSDYYNRHFQPVTVTSLPAAIFAEHNIDGSDWNGSHHARIAIMAAIAVHEACADKKLENPIPLILAMAETRYDNQSATNPTLVKQLTEAFPAWINPLLGRSVCTGRAAGMDALAFAFDYLYDISGDFILIGGSDSHLEDSCLEQLDNKSRLLTATSLDGFAPGEAAGFLLLTHNPELALISNGHVIALHPPGIADESGHWYSDEPYRGDGLDQAFKKALDSYSGQPVHSIYSSMNGETYWAKEYGVAFMRSSHAFLDPVRFEHPADCYGDIGSATAPVLIALAAHHLLTTSVARAHLVYSSSDTARRGAVLLEKIPLAELLHVNEGNR